MRGRTVRAMGIDPGTDRVGIGFVEYRGNSFAYKGSFLLPFKKNKDAGKNLLELERALKSAIRKQKPDIVGLETLFFSKNKKTALSVAEARGVILKAVAELRVRCVEIAPSEAKLVVAGQGNADKRQVAKMAGKFLKEDLSHCIDDETDALSIAITAAFRCASPL